MRDRRRIKRVFAASALRPDFGIRGRTERSAGVGSATENRRHDRGAGAKRAGKD